jgi:hypothetical protein
MEPCLPGKSTSTWMLWRSRSAPRWPGCARRPLDILPDAEQAISYGLPAFKIQGKTITGFAAFENHLSYLPHGGSVFPQLKEELRGYSTSSGALRFSIDEPPPVPLVEKLIAVRLQQAFPARGTAPSPAGGRQAHGLASVTAVAHQQPRACTGIPGGHPQPRFTGSAGRPLRGRDRAEPPFRHAFNGQPPDWDRSA